MSALRSKKVQIPIFAVVGLIVAYDVFVIFGGSSEGAPAPATAETAEAPLDPVPEVREPKSSTRRARTPGERFTGRNPFFFPEELERGKPITLLLEEKAQREREQRQSAERRMREGLERDVLAQRLLEAELRGVVVAPAGRSRVWIDGRILAEGQMFATPEIVLAAIRPDGAVFVVGGQTYVKELAPPPPETGVAEEGGGEGGEEAAPAEENEGTLLPVDPEALVPAERSLVPALGKQGPAESPGGALPGASSPGNGS